MQVLKKIVVILSILFMIFVADTIFAQDSTTDQLVNCDIQHQPCIQQVSGTSVFFDIQPKPVKAMKDLIFEIKVKNMDLAEPPVIDLGMPGMEMGPNHVKMKMIAAGVYQGTGIIVRCPSGKTIWQANINLPGKGSVNFIFNVIY
jgi:hypothetical protein